MYRDVWSFLHLSCRVSPTPSHNPDRSSLDDCLTIPPLPIILILLAVPLSLLSNHQHLGVSQSSASPPKISCHRHLPPPVNHPMSTFWSLHYFSPLRSLTDYHSILSETISPLNFHGSKPYWFFHVYSFSFFIFLEDKSLPSIFFCALVLLFKKSNMLFCFVFNCSVSIHFPRYRWVRKEKKKKNGV